MQKSFKKECNSFVESSINSQAWNPMLKRKPIARPRENRSRRQINFQNCKNKQLEAQREISNCLMINVVTSENDAEEKSSQNKGNFNFDACTFEKELKACKGSLLSKANKRNVDIQVTSGDVRPHSILFYVTSDEVLNTFTGLPTKEILNKLAQIIEQVF
ncbi:uncharacterized protein LOC105195526 [Solenopsis invicta]|uniref:uncharacterized protein LOC105195526 n=1 Tax=Solenopsis invicta TaxID=13686 RepID=UPI00193D9EEE|nr:uncharacterized protein LOC105195526 [Solenopsis invicta]